MKLKQFLFQLWPPYEAYITHKQIDRTNNRTGVNTRWDLIQTEIRNLLPDKDEANYKELQYAAEQIQNAEIKRKETLENKASTFIAGIGIATSIVSTVPVLFTEMWKIPTIWAATAGAAYLVAIIHLLIAAYYAVKVRRVDGFARPCADTFVESMKQNKGKAKDRIILTIAQTRWNENLILRKSNYLSVVEDLFLRGLAFVTFAAVIVVATKLSAY